MRKDRNTREIFWQKVPLEVRGINSFWKKGKKFSERESIMICKWCVNILLVLDEFPFYFLFYFSIFEYFYTISYITLKNLQHVFAMICQKLKNFQHLLASFSMRSKRFSRFCSEKKTRKIASLFLFQERRKLIFWPKCLPLS